MEENTLESLPRARLCAEGSTSFEPPAGHFIALVKNGSSKTVAEGMAAGSGTLLSKAGTISNLSWQEPDPGHNKTPLTLRQDLADQTCGKGHVCESPG